MRREQAFAPGVIVLGPGAGRLIPGPEGITVKASGEETHGSIGFLEATTPSGFGPPRHIHHDCDELFYVLGGQFLFLVGERLAKASPGTIVFVPRGTVHAPKSVGAEPGKVLIAFIPGGQERAFDELARLAAARKDDRDLTSDQLQALAREFHSEFVGPPL
jgi:mannose-6-phosphate isomerase-like protein (cupin superfamily)